MAYSHLRAQLAVAGGDEGVHLARIDLGALRAHRASPWGRALVGAADIAHPELCDFPRAPAFAGTGALGRMSVPL